ncbi:hypothetical protein [Dyella sp.]|uniref:hypothetical protein n=1 Tax=Dyella sp. TaxID=1869338 RepID=UPI002FDAB537
MLFGISAHPSSIHPNSFHPTELHPVENNHPSGSKPGGKEIEKPVSPVVTSGHDPFPPSSSGLPTSSSPMMSAMQDVHLSNDPGNYCARFTPENNGTYALYSRDAETGAPRGTGRYVRRDDNGNWTAVPSGLRGGGAGSSKQGYSQLDGAQPSGSATASSSGASVPRKRGNDGQSKYWVVEDGRGNTKPGDSSYDAYKPYYIYMEGPNAGKGTWHKGEDMSRQSWAYKRT